jgi:putative protease
MKPMEILAPVGGQQQLVAAVRAGADAVYLGAQGFNARRNAQNFDALGLPQAVAYAHGRGVKVHVTVNTLVTDGEIPALMQEIQRIGEAGPDAVIVQDLAVAALFRRHLPTMPLHASTQMTIHNLEGARALMDLGFSRVVLARELTLQEIETIAHNTPLEVETFIHGALCMSLSGQCYLSSLLGGRSGNRGLCAQPCRLNYRIGTREYALSLRDMSYIRHMEELAEAGVVSLKIEGRMKRPEYVAAAVIACRDALAGREPDLAALEAVFSRSGFTDGYLTGKRDLSMFGRRTKEDVERSAKALSGLGALYRREYAHIPVHMELTAQSGCPVTLSATDGKHTAKAESAPPQEAQTRPLDEEYARRSLGKTGNTPFVLGQLSVHAEPGLMIPASQLNQLRREALERLLDLRSVPANHPFVEGKTGAIPAFQRHREEPRLHVRLEQLSQLSPALWDAERITLPLGEIEQAPELIQTLGTRLVCELPALVFPLEEDGLRERLLRLQEQGLEDVCVHNLGALHLGRELGFRLHGGYGLNILNSIALAEYQSLGLLDATLSFECSLWNIQRMGRSLPVGILGYGHLPLMLLRACPAKGPHGCDGCKGQPALTDRLGTSVPLLCQAKRYTVLLNPIPLHLGHRKVSGMDFLTLYFTRETPEVCQSIWEDYRLGRAYEGPRTGGLYYRELQ